MGERNSTTLVSQVASRARRNLAAEFLMLCDSFKCSYCEAHLIFGSDETLRHIVEHVGEGEYLLALLRTQEQAGFRELAAQQRTEAVSNRLRQLTQ
jgi:5-methylcytosine-specific restriction endonuclease McrA